MRLRLTIQRNGLPAANILWAIPDTASASAYTVTRLLEDVSLVVPLEAEHWGLEHYVVEVGGFECLHFMPVAQCLKEDDHISIRPLMRAEIRARTLTGRDQISDAGQHLVDGVPFGRPYLRQASRPAVRIPPRKRQRLEEITPEGDGPRLREIPGVELVKAVHFQQPEVDMLCGDSEEEEEEDDDDDDDFAPGDGVEADGSADSDTNSSSDTDSSSASDLSAAGSSSDGSSSDDSSSDDSSSDDSSDSDSDAAPDVQSSKTPLPTPIVPPFPNTINTAPGQGKRATQSRNARRTKTNRLKYLKKTGKLPEHADLRDLDKYEEDARLQHEDEQPEPAHSFAYPSGKRKRLDTDDDDTTAADEAAELAKRKQEMMARLGDFDVVMETSDPPETQHSAPTPPSEQAEAGKAQERRRLRPDVSAIGRMLARQTKNLVKKPAKVKEATPEPEGSTDPDFWKSRINLSAFECWEEEYELTAPPFPFQQHWDPISKVMRNAAKARKGKGNKGRKPPVEEPQEKEEEEEEETILLNYDDSPDVQIHAAIEDQLQQDIATASQEQPEDNLPALPDDLSTLPDLTPADIKAGAVIVCKFFGVNPITVTPEISSFKTALVETEGDSGAGAGTIRLEIARRDLPQKEKRFNSKGERIYDAKDGFFMEEDEALWSGMFGELLEAKLLRAA